MAIKLTDFMVWENYFVSFCFFKIADMLISLYAISIKGVSAEWNPLIRLSISWLNPVFYWLPMLIINIILLYLVNCILKVIAKHNYMLSFRIAVFLNIIAWGLIMWNLALIRNSG